MNITPTRKYSKECQKKCNNKLKEKRRKKIKRLNKYSFPLVGFSAGENAMAAEKAIILNTGIGFKVESVRQIMMVVSEQSERKLYRRNKE